jgi:hypothetical protein
VRLYSAALFVHIIGVLLLSTSFTAEGIGLWLMRRGATALDWRRITSLARIFGPFSVVTILLPGLYMMLSTWGWTAWIAVSIVTWVLIAVLGALNGIRLSLSAAGSPASVPARAEFVVSWSTRITIALAVVLLMVAKPGLIASLLVVVVCAALGVAVGVLLHAAPVVRRVSSAPGE